ncbi:MAG TPA: hypothetical protein VES20_17230, partial [Bryobacteraceae bacterium]|nr:hypothetical protein [Bryobacteraceae bacterium]
RAQALQRRAATASNVMPLQTARPPSTAIPAEDPPPAPATPEDIREAARPQPPVELRADTAVRDLALRGTDIALWEQTAKSYGLDVIFEGDYQAGQPMTFNLDRAGYREALHALMTLTGSFIVPMSEKVLLVVKDTEAKRKEVENTVTFSVPIPDPFTIQEAQELGRTVQQVMEIQRFAIDSAQRLAIFRDRISKAVPAQLLFQQLVAAKPQVMIEVELMSVASTASLQIGLNLPTSFPLTAIQKTMTLRNLTFPEFALALGSARLMARADRSDVRTLYRAEMRAVDLQPAQLHVGQKYPIMNVSYIGDTSGGGDVYSPPPSFNFEDLGFVLKLTPKVHGRTEATFNVEAEFKLLGAGSANGIPVISNRKCASQVRLRFDETALISGLVTRNDLRVLTGPAGLLNVPVLGGLLGQTDRTRDDIQIVLAIRPRLLTPPPDEALTKAIWVGSDTRTRIPM